MLAPQNGTSAISRKGSRYAIIAIAVQACICLLIAYRRPTPHIPPTHVYSLRELEQQSRTVCTARNTNILSSNYNTTCSEKHCFAIVLTVNDGYFDFFLNWHHHYQIIRQASYEGASLSTENEKTRLIIIAEDNRVYGKLHALPQLQKSDATTIILGGGKDSTNNVSQSAEDYDSDGYKSLVSGRATHLLNLLCTFNAEANDASNEIAHGDWVLLYSDVDTVWLRDPIQIVRAQLFNESKCQGPTFDVLASNDSQNVTIDAHYCTGFLVVSPTPSSVVFLSQWENELRANPQLNQPIFNHLLWTIKTVPMRHHRLDEDQFPNGLFFFDIWSENGKRDEMLRQKTIAVVHNNFVIGHSAKKRRFDAHGLWNLTQL